MSFRAYSYEAYAPREMPPPILDADWAVYQALRDPFAPTLFPFPTWPVHAAQAIMGDLMEDVRRLGRDLQLSDETRTEMVKHGARIIERTIHFESHTDREGKTHTTGEAKQVEIQGSDVEDAVIKRESGELDLGEVATRYTYRLDAPDVEVLANNKRNNHDTGKRSAG